MENLKFTSINSPCFCVAPDLEEHRLNRAEPLKRYTNQWQFYFGKFPEFCAKIVDKPRMEALLKNGRRHVLQVPLLDRPRPTHLVQRDVMNNIEMIVTQIEKLGLTWRKTPAAIELDNVSFEFVVCDDTGIFHVLATNPTLIVDKTIVQADMNEDNINQLIFCFRALFMNRDPVDEFPLITRYSWGLFVHLTLSPDFDCVEFYPEWMDDENADWNISKDWEFFQPGI